MSVSRLLAPVYHKAFVHFYKCTIDSSNHDLRLTFVRVQALIYKVCRVSGKSVTSYIKISEGTPNNAHLMLDVFEYYITVQTWKCYYSEWMGDLCKVMLSSFQITVYLEFCLENSGGKFFLSARLQNLRLHLQVSIKTPFMSLTFETVRTGRSDTVSLVTMET